MKVFNLLTRRRISFSSQPPPFAFKRTIRVGRVSRFSKIHQPFKLRLPANKSVFKAYARHPAHPSLINQNTRIIFACLTYIIISWKIWKGNKRIFFSNILLYRIILQSSIDKIIFALEKIKFTRTTIVDAIFTNDEYLQNLFPIYPPISNSDQLPKKKKITFKKFISSIIFSLHLVIPSRKIFSVEESLKEDERKREREKKDSQKTERNDARDVWSGCFSIPWFRVSPRKYHFSAIPLPTRSHKSFPHLGIRRQWEKGGGPSNETRGREKTSGTSSLFVKRFWSQLCTTKIAACEAATNRFRPFNRDNGRPLVYGTNFHRRLRWSPEWSGE